MAKLSPYRWLLWLSVAMGMLWFLKIDKQSFYHHYFKVIAEVEMRNSSEVLPTQGLAIWQNASQLAQPSLLLLLLSFLGITATFAFLSNQRIDVPSAELQLVAVSHPHRDHPPVRAP